MSDDEKLVDAHTRLWQPPMCKVCAVPMDWTSLVLDGVRFHWCCAICGLLYSVEVKKP